MVERHICNVEVSGSNPLRSTYRFLEPFIINMNIRYNSEDVVDHDGVAAIIKNGAGEVLVQEHVKYGFWTIPVGKVKTGQNVQSGLKEEMFEECNLIIQESKEMCVKDYFYERDVRTFRVGSHGDEMRKYACEMKNIEPHKHRQQVFMSINKIMELPYLSDLTLLYLNQVGFDRRAHL